MSESPTWEEISNATESLLQAIGGAQRGWIRSRDVQGVGILERVATYCAFRALLNTFPATAVISDPDSLRALEHFADSIQLRTASAEELQAPRVLA